MRYLFSDDVDIPWTEEFGRLAMIWAAFWGAAALQRVDDHIRMSAVYDLLPAPLQKAVRVFGDVLVLLVLAPIVWLGWETARNLDIMNSISLGLPLSVFAYPVPIGGALMMVHTAGPADREAEGTGARASQRRVWGLTAWAGSGTSSSSSSRCSSCACRSRWC